MDSRLIHLLFSLYPSQGHRRTVREFSSQLILDFSPFYQGADILYDRPNARKGSSSSNVLIYAVLEKSHGLTRESFYSHLIARP